MTSLLDGLEVVDVTFMLFWVSLEVNFGRFGHFWVLLGFLRVLDTF